MIGYNPDIDYWDAINNDSAVLLPPGAISLDKTKKSKKNKSSKKVKEIQPTEN
jgi:hypothetical protein